jgi:predicted ATP-dependent serine protease
LNKEKASSAKMALAEDKASSAKKRKRMYNQNEIELEEKLLELDDLNRPKFKVALISGPPGLGKIMLFLNFISFFILRALMSRIKLIMLRKNYFGSDYS